MRQWLLTVSCLFLFAACDNIAPTPTPTRPISAPTLEASPTVLPLMQEEMPTQLQFVGQNDPTAAALPRDSDLPPLPVGTLAPGETRQSIQITAPDGIQLNGDLYVSPVGPDSPGVLMLSSDSRAWLDLPLRLQQQGYTVLAMPLRSGVAVNSDVALGDFGTMIEGLGQVSDPGHIAVVGAEGGADLALAGCAVQLLCKALVLLTPTSLEVAQANITRYNPRPIFLAVSQSDTANFGVVEYLRSMARGETGYDAPDGTTAYGMALLQAHPALGDNLIEWLRTQLN